MRFTAETSEGLEMKNFTSAITYPSPDWLTLVIPFPHPQPAQIGLSSTRNQ